MTLHGGQFPSWSPRRIELKSSNSLVRQNQGGGWSKVVLVTVEIVSVESKPPAAIGVRISKDERNDFGAAASMSTKTSSLGGRAGGSAFTPKMAELFGPSWTLFAVQLSPCFARNVVAAPSVRSRFFMSADTSASMARCGYQACCSRLAKC